MKKIKVSLAALAFLIAAGVSIAQTTVSSDLPECTDQQLNPINGQCRFTSGTECCEKNSVTWYSRP